MDDAINTIRNFFKLGKETEPIKEKIIRGIRNLKEQEEDYYKPIRADNFYSSNYIEYESNGEIDKNLSIDKCRNKIKSYLKDTLIGLQKLDA